MVCPEKITLLETALHPPCTKKDIFLYRVTKTGLVQQPDKIVVRSSHDLSLFVREAKLRLGINGHRVFIPLHPEPAGEAEVDWGTCTAILGSGYALFILIYNVL